MRGSTVRTLSLLLLAAAAPAGADWLVTRAGGRVETQGSWQVKGKLVVFKTPNGTLSSLRLADVDLAVSENVTAEAKAAEDEKAKAATEEPAKPERKKSVRSLTDADFSRKPAPAGDAAGADGTAGDKEGADGKAPAAPNAGANRGRVEVSSWSQASRAEGDGIDLFGNLQNSGDEMATDIVVKVQLFNEAKESVGTAEAVLAASSIPAGGTTSFRVPFSGVFTFSQAEFKVTSKTMTMKPASEETEKH
jgi:hypothetical protein